jgi:hypothetical protein
MAKAITACLLNKRTGLYWNGQNDGSFSVGGATKFCSIRACKSYYKACFVNQKMEIKVERYSPFWEKA